MPETDKVSEADRMEQASLERVVSDMERVLRTSPAGTSPLFAAFVQNAKARLGTLDKKIHEAEREKEQEARNEVAMVTLAQKEAALNEKEKEQYSGFLKEDFFTKKDFARLDDFYAHSWDRLSESGKEQMSHRTWEGIRRGEFKFTELPDSYREKEAKQAYLRLRDSSTGLGSAASIPEKDRNDFIHAYESGNRERSGKILDRDSFKKSMFRNESSTEVPHAARSVQTDAEGAGIVASVKADLLEKGKDQAKTAGNLDVSSIDLGGMTLGNSAAQGAVANLPRTQGGASRKC